MRITSIDTFVFEAPLKTPFVTALRRVTHLRDVVVRIETDDGLVGYGEGAPTPQITGETEESILASIEKIKPFVLSERFDSPTTLHKCLKRWLPGSTTARSAIETAFYDLWAKYDGVPLYRRLGGDRREIETDITISLDTPEKMAHDAKKAYAEGFRTLKIKIGGDPNKDYERILTIFRSVGSEARLRLDANQGWDAASCLTLLHRLERDRLPIECIEQPVAADDIEGLCRIRRESTVPLLADESVFSLEEARRLIEAGCVDMINVKLAKTGGLYEAIEIIELCREHGVTCMMGCMLEGPFAVAAAAHLAAAYPETVRLIDLDVPSLLAECPARTNILFDGARIVVNETPGIGVKPLSVE